MITEQVDRRVLGAVRLVDATSGAQINAPFLVQATDARFVRNRRGYYAIFEAPGLHEHTHAFQQPPTAPPVGSIALQLTVQDPGGRYLPRLAQVQLPRDPNPENVEALNSLFTPVSVSMFRSPLSSPSAGWAVVRASVTATGTGQPLRNTLLRITRTVDSDTVLLGRGLSDRRGEALVAVTGIPVTTWAEDDSDSVIVTEIEATLEAFFDPAAEAIVDPDDLEERRGALPTVSVTVNLALGRELTPALSIPLP